MWMTRGRIRITNWMKTITSIILIFLLVTFIVIISSALPDNFGKVFYLAGFVLVSLVVAVYLVRSYRRQVKQSSRGLEPNSDLRHKFYSIYTIQVLLVFASVFMIVLFSPLGAAAGTDVMQWIFIDIVLLSAFTSAFLMMYLLKLRLILKSGRSSTGDNTIN